MAYTIESFGISDVGLSREKNEDVFHEIPLHSFFVLADGMGGHNAGEVAAKEVIHHLSSSICQLFSTEENFPPLPSFLHNAIVKANHWVHQLSEQKLEFQGMGTTLCCLLIHEQKLIYGHVGDSRIYRFRDALLQMTQDHRSSSLRGKKNMITRAIGTTPHIEPDIAIESIHPGDIYFLCSDGLTDYVSDHEISTILEKNGCIKTASKQLVHAAKTKGGGDNITILMLKVAPDA
jgi:protein phosphatase